MSGQFGGCFTQTAPAKVPTGQRLQAISFVATTEGIKGEDVRDLMTVAVETRFGPVNRLPGVIEWLTDTGSGYIAGETRRSNC